MNLVIFLFVTALFLFFLGSYVCSPEHNPKVKEVMDDAESVRQGKRVTREHAFSEDLIKIMAGLFNGAAILLTLGLVVGVPFFRVIAATAMAVMAARFFYKKHFSGTPATNFVPAGGSTARHEGYHSESDGQEMSTGRPGTGGGTSH